MPFLHSIRSGKLTIFFSHFSLTVTYTLRSICDRELTIQPLLPLSRMRMIAHTLLLLFRHAWMHWGRGSAKVRQAEERERGGGAKRESYVLYVVDYLKYTH